MQAPGRPIGLPPVLVKRRNTAVALALSGLLFAAAGVLVNENYSEIARDDILSIVSITVLCLAPLLAWPAVLMSAGDLKKIRQGVIPPSLFRVTRLTWILGVVGAAANTFLFVMFLSLAATEPGPGQSREAMIHDLNALIRIAYDYRNKGDKPPGSYAGFILPPSLAENEHGYYSVTILHADTIQFVGRWWEDPQGSLITVKAGPRGNPVLWRFEGNFRD